MNIFRVAFIGHRKIENHFRVEKMLNEVVSDLIRKKEFVEFRLGRNGAFDVIAASCIKNAQRSFEKDNSEMTLVLAYPVADMEYYEKYYDNVIIPRDAEKIYFKGAITERNKWFVDNCDLLVCYVENRSGGAGYAIRYAERAGVNILNLASGIDLLILRFFSKNPNC